MVELTAASAIVNFHKAVEDVTKDWTEADWEEFEKFCQTIGSTPSNLLFPSEGECNNG